MVTLKAARGRDFGRAIVEQLAGRAANAGVRELYLLSESAPGFFAACGFHEVPGERVPDEIAASEEFFTRCPASAASLMRVLERRGPA